MINPPKINICVEPFINLNVDKIYGKSAVAPCCIYPPIKTNTIDFYNDPVLNHIRAQWSAGEWPVGCRVCREVEQTNHISRRQQELWSYTLEHGHEPVLPMTTQLTKLDYWVGDTCNQACITCGPKYSSLWKQELKITGEISRQVINTQWQTTDLSTVRTIHFYGGEPLLNKNHLDFLSSIEDLSKISLVYNTNASVQPTDAMLATWAACDQVMIMLSIDDTEQRFEYVRYPGQWDRVNDNIDWMLANKSPNVTFGINRVISILTKFYPETVPDWAIKKFKSNAKFKGVYEQSAFGPLNPEGELAPALEHLELIDRRRKLNWQQVFPRAAESLIPNKTAK